MKCNKCDKEASFYYSTNTNGEFNETRLCLDCAREEGFGQMLEYRPMRMMDMMFASPLGGFFPSFPSPVGLLISTRDNVPACDVCRETQADKIPHDAGEDIKKRRELAALKNQLESAVKSENFEKAIELRDRIREMEK